MGIRPSELKFFSDGRAVRTNEESTVNVCSASRRRCYLICVRIFRTLPRRIKRVTLIRLPAFGRCPSLGQIEGTLVSIASRGTDFQSATATAQSLLASSIRSTNPNPAPPGRGGGVDLFLLILNSCCRPRARHSAWTRGLLPTSTSRH